MILANYQIRKNPRRLFICIVYSMSSIVQLIYNRYLRRFSYIILVIILLVIFVLLGVYGYKKYYESNQKTKPFDDVANANTRGKPAQVLFFFANWCPHCKNAKPEWYKFKEEYEGKKINGWQIQCIEIDCTDENNETSNKLIAEYKVESYPTIIMVVGDNKINFDSRVTSSALGQLVVSGTK
jgi:thiol-disulfide isomerase/thioredoxin